MAALPRRRAILLMVHCLMSILASPGRTILAPVHFVLRLNSRWSAGQLMDRVLVQVMHLHGRYRDAWTMQAGGTAVEHLP